MYSAIPSVQMTPPALNGFGSALISGGELASDPLAANLQNASMEELAQAEIQSQADMENARSFAWGALLSSTLLTGALVFVVYRVLTDG